MVYLNRLIGETYVDTLLEIYVTAPIYDSFLYPILEGEANG